MSKYIDKRGISLELAQQVAAAAVAHATEMGGAFTVVVVDDTGVTKVASRMDGAALSSLHAATNKAYSAIATGFSTKEWFDFTAADPQMAAGAQGMERLMLFEGGLLIEVDGHRIGAIGVSGGHYSQDTAVAEAGLAVV